MDQHLEAPVKPDVLWSCERCGAEPPDAADNRPDSGAFAATENSSQKRSGPSTDGGMHECRPSAAQIAPPPPKLLDVDDDRMNLGGDAEASRWKGEIAAGIDGRHVEDDRRRIGSDDEHLREQGIGDDVEGRGGSEW